MTEFDDMPYLKLRMLAIKGSSETPKSASTVSKLCFQTTPYRFVLNEGIL
ncbi:hypothetical protein [Neisseria sicca]|nr:hypothetical protein [Neisseria sicca]